MSYYTSNAYLTIQVFWNEPDIYEATINGYYVTARRNPAKAWCGYIRVPLDHPKANSEDLDCHGGVTWNSDRAPWMTEPDGYSWLGFDCLHYGDVSPEAVFRELVTRESSFLLEGYYRGLEYVKRNLENMVKSLDEKESAE